MNPLHVALLLGCPVGLLQGTNQQASSSLFGCPCPVGTPENEPLCRGVNAGCTSPPYEDFGSVSLGETICGTSSYDIFYRDTDWFEFVLPERRNIEQKESTSPRAKDFTSHGTMDERALINLIQVIVTYLVTELLLQEPTLMQGFTELKQFAS